MDDANNGEGTSGEDKEASNGKPCHIVAIIRGMPRENIRSNGLMKMRIVELIVVHKKDKSVLTKTFDKIILGFQNSEKIFGEILNEIFSPVITTTISHFDVTMAVAPVTYYVFRRV